MSTEWIDEDIESLCDVSEECADYMDRELYLADFGTEVDIKTILDRLYTILEDELEDLGVIIIDDNLYQDWFLRRRLISLRKVLDSENLNRLLTTHVDKDLKDTLLSIISTSRPGRLLEAIITKLIDIVPQDHDLEMAGEMIYYHVSCNERLYDHVKAVLNNVPDTIKMLKSIDEKAVSEYLRHIERDRRNIKQFIDTVRPLIVTKGYTLDEAFLKSVIDSYDLDKTTSDNIAIYAQVDKDEVHPSLIDIQKQYMDAHHGRSPHHVEYYKERHLTVSNISQMMVLVGHHFDPEINHDEFTTKVRDMMDNNTDIIPPNLHQKVFDILSVFKNICSLSLRE